MAVLLAIVAAGFGCKTEEASFPRILNEPAPLPESARGRFGVIGILPIAAATNLHFTQPVVPNDVATKMSQKTYRELEQMIGTTEGPAKDEPQTVSLNALFTAEPGAGRAVVSGVGESDFQYARGRLRAALDEEPFEAGLQRHFGMVVGGRDLPRLKLLSEEAMAKVQTRNFRADFSALAEEGVHSVMDIRVTELGFDAKRGENPPMEFRAEVTIYIFRVSDGTVLHGSVLDYGGSTRRLGEWASGDARPFRAELNSAQTVLVEAILEEYFGSAAQPVIRPAE